MPRRLLKPNRLGYRGGSLILLGLIFLNSGLPLLLGLNRFEPFEHPMSFGIPVWAAGFTLAGLWAITTGFIHKPKLKKIAFQILSAVGNSWVAFTLLLQFAHYAHLVWPHTVPNFPTVGWLNIFENTVVMTLVWLISGWDEPIEPLNLAERRRT